MDSVKIYCRILGAIFWGLLIMLSTTLWQAGHRAAQLFQNFLNDVLGPESAYIVNPYSLLFLFIGIFLGFRHKNGEWLIGTFMTLPFFIIFGVMNFGDGPLILKYLFGLSPMLGGFAGIIVGKILKSLCSK